jgi:hypothetical protein
VAYQMGLHFRPRGIALHLTQPHEEGLSSAHAGVLLWFLRVAMSRVALPAFRQRSSASLLTTAAQVIDSATLTLVVLRSGLHEEEPRP